MLIKQKASLSDNPKSNAFAGLSLVKELTSLKLTFVAPIVKGSNTENAFNESQSSK